MSTRNCVVTGGQIHECDGCGFTALDPMDWEHEFKIDRDLCPMCVRERIEGHLAKSRARNVVEDAAEGSTQRLIKSWLYDLI